MRDGIFWIVVSFLLILVSVFPVLAVWASRLLGMQVEEVISRLEGINCGGRGTSCPDQLAKALKAAQ